MKFIAYRDFRNIIVPACYFCLLALFVFLMLYQPLDLLINFQLTSIGLEFGAWFAVTVMLFHTIDGCFSIHKCLSKWKADQKQKALQWVFQVIFSLSQIMGSLLLLAAVIFPALSSLNGLVPFFGMMSSSAIMACPIFYMVSFLSLCIYSGFQLYTWKKDLDLLHGMEGFETLQRAVYLNCFFKMGTTAGICICLGFGLVAGISTGICMLVATVLMGVFLGVTFHEKLVNRDIRKAKRVHMESSGRQDASTSVVQRNVTSPRSNSVPQLGEARPPIQIQNVQESTVIEMGQIRVPNCG